jgi:hypothetical protein
VIFGWQDKEAYLQVVKQEKHEAKAVKLLREEQMHWTTKELLGQYIKFRQEVEEGADGNKGKRKNKKNEKERHTALVAKKKNMIEALSCLILYHFLRLGMK